MGFDPLAAPPLLTQDLPGIGGQIKQAPEDFDVEEIPAYEPSGQGQFLYLWIEKRGMGAEYFQRQVAHRLGIAAGEVGTAGLKDRQAVTRQWVSVPEVEATRLAQLESADLHVLRVSRHGNKLRPGHLHGNRFRILVRQPDAAAATRLGPLLARLQEQGLPNYYGAQRFGRDGETVHLGLSLLHGEPAPTRPGRRPNLRNPFLRKLALSAAQSALFNHYLGQRLRDGLLHQVVQGDVMGKWPFGGLFVAQELSQEQLRFQRRETVHTGPIFGKKMFLPTDNAAEREAAVLLEAGLKRDAFRQFGKLLQGTRRHNLVYLDDLSATMGPEGIRLQVTLPAGSYATVLLGELMKSAELLSCTDDPDAREERS
jgi:tRNA pseudouridine13 synthase